MLLAVARSVGISIDEVAGRPPVDGQPPAADRLYALEGQVATLSEVVRRLEKAAAVSERRAVRREWASRSKPAAPPPQPIPGSRPANRSRRI